MVCGADCFDGVRHRCRKPSKDAAAMIELQQELVRLRAALEKLKRDCVVGDVPDATMIDYIDSVLGQEAPS